MAIVLLLPYSAGAAHQSARRLFWIPSPHTFLFPLLQATSLRLLPSPFATFRFAEPLAC